MGNLEEKIKLEIINDALNVYIESTLKLLDLIYNQCAEFSSTISDVKVIPLEVLQHVIDSTKEGLKENLNG